MEGESIIIEPRNDLRVLFIGITNQELDDRINGLDNYIHMNNKNVKEFTTLSNDHGSDIQCDLNVTKLVNKLLSGKKFDLIVFDRSTTKFLNIESVLNLKKFVANNGSLWVPIGISTTNITNGPSNFEVNNQTQLDHVEISKYIIDEALNDSFYNKIVKGGKNVDDLFECMKNLVKCLFLKKVVNYFEKEGFIETVAMHPLLLFDSELYGKRYMVYYQL